MNMDYGLDTLANPNEYSHTAIWYMVSITIYPMKYVHRSAVRCLFVSYHQLLLIYVVHLYNFVNMIYIISFMVIQNRMLR